jgi:putative ABC transport system permease protein
LAIAAIIALGAVCLAGTPLYLSSVATAAMQSELNRTCLADVALHIPVAASQPDASAALSELTAPLAKHTQPGVLSRVARLVILDIGGGQLPRQAFLVYREGQEQHLQRGVATPGAGEVLTPEWLGAPHGPRPGDTVTLTAKNSKGVVIWTHPVKVADTYPLVPTRPEPAYWCGLRNFFRSQTGDPADLPPPVLLTTSDEVRTARVPNTADWELRPNPEGLSRHDATVLAAQFDEYMTKAKHVVIVSTRPDDSPLPPGNALRAVVRHAEAASRVVGGTMAPVRLVGLIAAIALLISATTLLAREHQRELRLRLLKGQAPLVLGVRIALRALLAVLSGTLVGTAIAFAGVHYFGPSSLMEPGPVRVALAETLVGMLLALVIIIGAATARSRTFVDAPTRSRSWLRFAPWELIPVVGVVVAFARLDRIGGIRQVGTKVANADFLAQCFPVLAIIAPLAVLARPTLLLLRRCRLAGRRLPPALMTGLRRSLAEPVVTGALLLATALAAGSFAVARLLTDSTNTLLRDKANTFIGSDLSIVSSNVSALPPPFSDSGTVVARAQGHSGTQSVDLLGVDPATFARAVHWRADGSSAALDTMLTQITPRSDAAIPALVVGGPLPSTTIDNLVHHSIVVRPLASPRWFPGLHNGATLVVVDRETLKHSMATATEIWLRDPPADAVTQLSSAGLVVRNARDLSQVFDVTSFQTVRWAYATLSMLAALVGVVVLLTQLLVLDARRQIRQAAHVLTLRMGLTMSGEAAGLTAELAPALVVGALLGATIGWAVSRVSVPRLDSLRQLEPPARVVAHVSAAMPLITGVVGALVVLIGVGLVMVRRTRTMEVMRGTA